MAGDQMALQLGQADDVVAVCRSSEGIRRRPPCLLVSVERHDLVVRVKLLGVAIAGQRVGDPIDDSDASGQRPRRTPYIPPATVPDAKSEDLADKRLVPNKCGDSEHLVLYRGGRAVGEDGAPDEFMASRRRAVGKQEDAAVGEVEQAEPILWAEDADHAVVTNGVRLAICEVVGGDVYPCDGVARIHVEDGDLVF